MNKQLTFPPPLGRPVIDLLRKIIDERIKGVTINYHFKT